MVLMVNFLCFIIISISYIIIHTKTVNSSRSLDGPKNKELARRNRKLQIKVSAIILTDFFCWIPFTAICFVHYAGAVDATTWYPIFSSIILPINSVINPLLYDTYLGSFIFHPVRSTIRSISNMTIIRRQCSPETDEAAVRAEGCRQAAVEIEMEEYPKSGTN